MKYVEEYGNVAIGSRVIPICRHHDKNITKVIINNKVRIVNSIRMKTIVLVLNDWLIVD